MSIPFVETPLVTPRGEFLIRVYEQPSGQETVVLYTKNFAAAPPVLVRIHSECLTGDIFKSLYCDCGQQLDQSLLLIQKEGGILIYLRQEGRGIGLVEKIKAYQLQRQGLDTFEANLKLGHAPDERTYEMAKTALSDLGISKVRLLTNNPDKIAALENYGIEVAERVPLVIETTDYNQKYIATKREKLRQLL